MMRRARKQRFELEGDRVRALYGHSLPGKLVREEARPPDRLYHGTSPSAVSRIRADGLRPMGRQYVHLSVDEPTAREVGHRRSDRPVILVIRAAEAHAAGVTFYRGNERVWLADAVPPDFLER